MTLPPSFNSDDNFEQAWADYATAEAQKQGAIPAHMSPRSVQAFFEELLPPPSEADAADDDGPDLIEECNQADDWLSDTQGDVIQASEQTAEVAEDAAPRAAPTINTSKKATVRFGEAQMEHIRQYRRLIDDSQCEEFYKNWRSVLISKPTIGPKRAKVSPSDYYIRASAVWIPHIVIPDYVPCCPCCKSSASVDVSKSRWVQYPTLCYSRPNQKYLDTVTYPCTACKKQFRGTNLESMALDESGVVRAVFRFRILHRCAVDEELFLDIVKRPLEATNSIFNHLRSQSAQRYVSDVIEFLIQVKYENANAPSSRPISSYMVNRGASKKGNDTTGMSTSVRSDARNQRLEIIALEGKLAGLEQALADDLLFADVAKSKQARKGTQSLAGFGKARIEKLASVGIISARQLLDAYNSNDTVVTTLK
jgi:hypothetical protein